MNDDELEMSIAKDIISKTVQRIDLNGEWQFRLLNNLKPEILNVPEGLDAWMPAMVPGTVYTDLMASEKIQDPFFSNNELKVQWVGEADWEYRRTFYVAESFLKQRKITLVCEGLDTLATIFLNDKEISVCRNMFISKRFDIGNYLMPGKNEIRIRFESPLVYSRNMENTHGKLTETRHSHRVYIRKAQYSFGWDWGPQLPTSGIWRPIYLEMFNKLRISDVSLKTVSCSQDEAHLEVEVTLDKLSNEGIRYHIEIDGGDELISKDVFKTENHFRFSIMVPDPRLWWPNGYGEPFLYNVRFTAYFEELLLDETTCKFGIRTVELKLKNEDDTNCFRIYINGEPVFCKGADWIPADSFIPRVTQEKYKRLLQMTRDASMNMLRVWGGGIYENPCFYQMCDEMGIMVWQDFMFACGVYPENDEFLRLVREEAESVIRQLRNHSSLVIWCGNNENEWIWSREGDVKPEKMTGFRIFHHILPEICQTLDPSRPYWPTSPWGGKNPNSQEEGNHHSWNIWSKWEDFENVKKDKGLFISEFGFQAPANVVTLESCLESEDRDPQSKIFEFHNKQEEGQERLFRFLAGHQKVTAKFIPFIYACQVNQAEALNYCIEHWRRRKFQTAGTLIWQLNDCWPAISWSLIDSNGIPKAAYYYARRFFANILLSIEKVPEELNIWIVNDYLKDMEGRINVSCQSFNGEVYFSKEVDVSVPQNGSLNVLTISNQELNKIRYDSSYIRAVFQCNQKNEAEAVFFFDQFKYLYFQTADIEARIDEKQGENIILGLSATTLLKSVYLHSSGWEFSDNFFDIHPNETRRVNVKKVNSSIKEFGEIYSLSIADYDFRKVHWINE